MPRDNRSFSGKNVPAKSGTNVFETEAAKGKEGYAEVGWDNASAGALQRTIKIVTNAGGALLFARTSDGGALSLTLFYGNDKKKVYVSPADDTDEILNFWAGFFETLS